MPIDLRALALLSAGPTYNLTASTIDFSTGRTTLASAVTTFVSTGSVDAACGAAHDATRGRFVVPEVGALAELADTTGKSKRVLARVKLDTATVDHVALDTSFSPVAAGGYQGPEWAAPAVA